MYRQIDNEKQLIVVTASRTFFHFRKRYSLLRCNFVEIEVSPQVNLDLAETIVDKLSEKGYLDILQSKEKTEQVQFVAKQGDILSALMSVSYGTGFKKRLSEDFARRLTHTDDAVEFLTLLSLMHKADIPFLPDELASVLYGVGASSLLDKVSDFIKLEGNGYALRTDYIVSLLLDRASSQSIVAAITKLFMAVSAQITEQENDYWKSMFQSLCCVKFLTRVIRLQTNAVRELLFDLRDNFKHLSYYWLQLGLLEQELNDFEKALNRFRQAQAINPRSYQIEHAIGRNFCKHARSLNDRTLAESLFEQGKEILVGIIENRERYQARAYSTHCLIFETISYFEKFRIDPTRRNLEELANYLKALIDKDPNDVMAKSVSNQFYRFLSKHKKLGILRWDFYDLQKYRGVLYQNEEDVESMLDDSDA